MSVFGTPAVSIAALFQVSTPTVRNQRTGTFLSTCVTSSKKKNSILCKGATLRSLLLWGVHDIHSYPSFTGCISSFHTSLLAVAVEGLAKTCSREKSLHCIRTQYKAFGKPPSPGVLNFDGCNCKGMVDLCAILLFI